jgi:hypothetical protein
MKKTPHIQPHGRSFVFYVDILIIFGVGASFAAPTQPRQDIRFSNSWKFFRGEALGAQQPAFVDDAWEMVCLPHTARLESAKSHSDYDYYKGICWYRKSFTPDAGFKGKKVFLEFEAAMQSTDVYLNGTKIFSYLGGYNPFVIDITNSLKFDSANVIAARLDNMVNTDVSPGNSAPDFYYYGGLYRYVNLHVTDKMHITDPLLANKVAGGGVFVTYPSVSAASATVQVKTDVANEYSDARNGKLVTTILDRNGSTVVQNAQATFTLAAGKDTTLTQNLIVSNPRQWHPNTPNLYFVRSQVFDAERIADEMRTTIGIRTISFSRSGGCQINGTRLISRGANRHQDYGFVGNAVPVSGQYRDALRLKEGGFNFVRLSHYLQHRSFLDACDKLGITVQASLVGWQYNGFSNSTFVNNSIRDLRTMIRYYRNHPCIIMWESVHNESKPPASFAEAAQSAAHAEYPGAQMFTCGQESNNIMDIYQAAVQQGGRDYAGSKPAAISEYGHWEEGGFTSTSNKTRADGEKGLLDQAENHVWGMNENHKLSWLSVDAVWVYNDYFGMAQYDKSLCSGGVVDMFRIPKFSYYCYQSQRDPKIVMPGVKSGPSVFIASYWTASSNVAVRVFSNCEKVSLYLNNTLVASRSPDITYGNIEHSTFTFSIPSFQAGTLRADGLIGGNAVVTQTVNTPATAAKVAVAIDTAGLDLEADGADFAIVYASIVDDNGTVMPAAANAITFSVAGPGKILSGDGNPIAAVGGMAAVYVQTKYNEPGVITVSANATGLAQGGATVRSVPVSNILTQAYAPRMSSAVSRKLEVLKQGTALSVVIPPDVPGIALKPRFCLYNLQGRLMRSFDLAIAGKTLIDLNDLGLGNYYGKLTCGNKEYSARIVTIKP